MPVGAIRHAEEWLLSARQADKKDAGRFRGKKKLRHSTLLHLAGAFERLGRKGGRINKSEILRELFSNESSQKGAGPAEEAVKADFIRDFVHDRLNGREGPGIEAANFVRKLFNNKIGRDSHNGEAGTGGWTGYKGKWISF